MKTPIPCFNETTLGKLFNETITTLSGRPLVVSVDSPVNIIGSTDGNIIDLLRLLSRAGRFMDQTTVFLGGYCHKAHFSLECVTLVLALFNVYPDNFVVLRGRSEWTQLRECGLIDDIVDRFGPGSALEHELLNVLASLPVMAVVDKEYVCTSGGIGSLNAMRELKRPKGDKDKLVELVVNANPMNEEQLAEEFLGQTKMKKVISGYVDKPILNGVETLFDGLFLVVSSASTIDAKHRIGYITISKESKLRALGITPSRQMARVYAKFEMLEMTSAVNCGRLFFKCLAMENHEQKRDISMILANGQL